ncbi:MAG: dihydrofolate reductase [Nitrosomonas sp.]|nr:dihydrofolate reductase [Nitrosomonas sp.]
MTQHRLAILAAVAANRVIGIDNTLPWHLPADLKHFKTLTIGQIVVMGRRTFESIGFPLPGRTNVVLTQQADLVLPGVNVVGSMNDVLDQFANDARSIFVIGGAQIYQEALPLCQRLYLTEIQQSFAGDTFFPEFERDEWHEISREIHRDSSGIVPEFHFVVLERNQ